jgi:5,6-dimethylbenzimidazole synthase
VGWVSVLDPDQLNDDLEINPDWALVAYLCIGWPSEETLTPELETVGWETRQSTLANLIEK